MSGNGRSEIETKRMEGPFGRGAEFVVARRSDSSSGFPEKATGNRLETLKHCSCVSISSWHVGGITFEQGWRSSATEEEVS